MNWGLMQFRALKLRGRTIEPTTRPNPFPPANTCRIKVSEKSRAGFGSCSMSSTIHTFQNQALPPTAALSLSEDGEALVLTFDAHAVLVPLTDTGLRLIKEVLKARRTASQRTVGTRGALTQALVDEWLKTNKPKRDDDLIPELDLEGIEL